MANPESGIDEPAETEPSIRLGQLFFKILRAEAPETIELFQRKILELILDKAEGVNLEKKSSFIDKNRQLIKDAYFRHIYGVIGIYLLATTKKSLTGNAPKTARSIIMPHLAYLKIMGSAAVELFLKKAFKEVSGRYAELAESRTALAQIMNRTRTSCMTIVHLPEYSLPEKLHAISADKYSYRKLPVNMPYSILAAQKIYGTDSLLETFLIWTGLRNPQVSKLALLAEQNKLAPTLKKLDEHYRAVLPQFRSAFPAGRFLITHAAQNPQSGAFEQYFQLAEGNSSKLVENLCLEIFLALKKRNTDIHSLLQKLLAPEYVPAAGSGEEPVEQKPDIQSLYLNEILTELQNIYSRYAGQEIFSSCKKINGENNYDNIPEQEANKLYDKIIVWIKQHYPDFKLPLYFDFDHVSLVKKTGENNFTLAMPLVKIEQQDKTDPKKSHLSDVRFGRAMVSVDFMAGKNCSETAHFTIGLNSGDYGHYLPQLEIEICKQRDGSVTYQETEAKIITHLTALMNAQLDAMYYRDIAAPAPRLRPEAQRIFTHNAALAATRWLIILFKNRGIIDNKIIGKISREFSPHDLYDLPLEEKNRLLRPQYHNHYQVIKPEIQARITPPFEKITALVAASHHPGAAPTKKTEEELRKAYNAIMKNRSAAPRQITDITRIITSAPLRAEVYELILCGKISPGELAPLKQKKFLELRQAQLANEISPENLKTRLLNLDGGDFDQAVKLLNRFSLPELEQMMKAFCRDPQTKKKLAKILTEVLEHKKRTYLFSCEISPHPSLQGSTALVEFHRYLKLFGLTADEYFVENLKKNIETAFQKNRHKEQQPKKAFPVNRIRYLMDRAAETRLHKIGLQPGRKSAEVKENSTAGDVYNQIMEQFSILELLLMISNGGRAAQVEKKLGQISRDSLNSYLQTLANYYGIAPFIAVCRKSGLLDSCPALQERINGWLAVNKALLQDGEAEKALQNSQLSHRQKSILHLYRVLDELGVIDQIMLQQFKIPLPDSGRDFVFAKKILADHPEIESSSISFIKRASALTCRQKKSRLIFG